MGRNSNLPTLYDYCYSFSIADLKGWKYLNDNQYKSGTITFRSSGGKTGSISITVNTWQEPYLELDYTHNGKHVNYRVTLVTIPSNLGKGIVWYFSCPKSGKRCKKLHMIDTYFYHRSAFSDGIYHTQTLGYKDKFLVRQFDRMTKGRNAKYKLNSKHFKKYYNGKATKQYLKVLNAMKAGEGISEDILLLS